MDPDTIQGWESPVGRSRRVTPVVVGVFVLVAVAACVAILMMLREPPRETAAKTIPPIHAREASAAFRGQGTVTPQVRVDIMPEVPGRVVYAHSQLRAGGLIRANERILQIDPTDYELAVRRARAAVDEAQARLDLALVATGARLDQGQPFGSPAEMDSPLALREPAIRQAGAALESVKAELTLAELQLGRTSLVLPFDVLIVGETVSLGQYVDAGRPVAVACGTEVFEIEAPVRDEDLARCDVLRGMSLVGHDPQATGAAAEVKAIFAGVEYTWQGRVVGTTGEVDRTSGMLSIVVEVPRPLEASGGRPPLLPGMVVEVLIAGDEKAGVLKERGDMGEP